MTEGARITAVRADHFSALDLLDLPPLERDVLLRLTRHGPVAVETLASALGHDPAAIDRTVAALVDRRRLRVLADGRVDVSLGLTSRRTTLPTTLWPALAGDRPYTTQEIATLRTAIPILQFARARMSEFADHGPSHALRVRSFAVQLAYLIGLTASERHLLRIAALFHDVGNVVDRERHHIVSQETVEKLAATGDLPFTPREAGLIGLICRWHRREYDPDRVDLLDGVQVRTGLLASVLRVADAMDIDHRRSDYDDRARHVLRYFYPDELPFWTSLEEIGGVRIRSAASVRLQVFTRRPVTDNVQIDMLTRDVAATPFDWSVEPVAVEPVAVEPVSAGPRHDRPTPPASAQRPPALLVFPFDPHSLVMAALSRNHLVASGEEVELLCYPDSPGGSRWLWDGALAETEPGGYTPDGYTRLVVIGDRPDATVTTQVLDRLRRWRAGGAAVSVLNRYEANWSRLPQLAALGVDVTVGGDWAYFWGDAASPRDLAWGRIAALCARDSTMASGLVTTHEHAVTHGYLDAVYEALAASTHDAVADWRSRADPILARVEADDQAFFAARAGAFAAGYASADASGRVDGRVLIFDHPPGPLPQAFPWVLEAAIERQGRVPERGLRFNVPHAVAAWPDGDAVEILAVTHWREDDALPIRLLYPDDFGPHPQGNEHALRVRVAAEHAPALVKALVDACNRP